MKWKMCRVGWRTVCKPKRLGGIGVVDLRLRNLSLLAKWACRYATEGDSLWKYLIMAKYGFTIHLWRWKISCPRCMSTVWHQTVQVQDEECVQRFFGFQQLFLAAWLWNDGSLFVSSVVFRSSIVYMFTRFFCLASAQLSSVSKWAVDGTFMHDSWSSFFSRDLRLFQVWQLDELHRVVGFAPLLRGIPDRLIWEPNIHGNFSVKELASMMHSFWFF
ncbi:hypothetical protein GQ457_01G024220 [Hibiscus cannabinus]